MRILVSGYHNPHYWTVTEYIERAIRALGHELAIFDDGTRLIPGRIRQRSRWAEHADQSWLNRRLVAAVRSWRPDVLLVLGGEVIAPETVRSVRGRGMTAVLWTIDAPWNFGPVLRSAPVYDHVFCQGTEAVEILRRAGIERANWLPMACEPALHRPIGAGGGQAPVHDVVFVGSWYENREALLASLRDVDLGLWGPGWDRLDPGSILRGRLRGRNTTPEQWREIYGSARIALAVHFRDPRGRIPCHQASPRIFEAMACGAFVLADRQRDVLELFREGEHMACFSDAGDLAETVRHYLARPDERERIARQGREAVLRGHTYEDRLKRLLEAAGCHGAKRLASGTAT